jgi:hypothetical protein
MDIELIRRALQKPGKSKGGLSPGRLAATLRSSPTF